MPHRTGRRRRWLRRLALGLRLAVGVLTLGVFVVASLIAAQALGEDSPLVWTISLLLGLAFGVLLMGKPALHVLADRLEREADGNDHGQGQSDPSGSR